MSPSLRRTSNRPPTLMRPESQASMQADVDPRRPTVMHTVDADLPAADTTFHDNLARA